MRGGRKEGQEGDEWKDTWKEGKDGCMEGKEVNAIREEKEIYKMKKPGGRMVKGSHVGGKKEGEIVNEREGGEEWRQEGRKKLRWTDGRKRA